MEITVEEQAEFVLNLLQEQGRTSFRKLCLELGNKIKVVVTFLSILEMLKEQQIDLFVDDDPTDFHIDLKPVDEIIGSNQPTEKQQS